MKRTIEYIEKLICRGEFIEPTLLHTSDRSEPYNTTRQMIMTLAVESGYTFKEVGAYFGRDHSTVTSARRSIYNRLDTEKWFADKFKYYAGICGNKETPPVEHLSNELARLRREAIELQQQINQIAI
jgi:DNA-binding NarL/FixJ family response regulator